MSGARAPRPPSLKGRPWLMDPVLQALLRALGRDMARVVGGAVRNALMGEPVADVDIATAWPPREAMARAAAAGFSTHPVAVEHGSVIVSMRGRAFEVTTLREDVETDGRHARVAFVADWAADAARRDFTINALYADAGGEVFDPLGGYGDILARRVRFIGDPRARIAEDYLRILRFFRFWARYGRQPPDAGALTACAEGRAGLRRISRERVRAEMEKLLVAPRAVAAMLFMAETGVGAVVLPAECRGDHAALARMAATDARFGLEADWLLRLAALCGPSAALKEAFRLSRAEARRLTELAAAYPPAEKGAADGWRAFVYERGAGAALDAARLAHARGALEEAGLRAAIAAAREWEPPVFPLGGRDARAAGIAPGPRMGQLLRRLEKAWVAAGFRPEGRAALLERLKDMAREEQS